MRISDKRCATVDTSGSALQMLHEGLESARCGGLHDMGSRMKRLSLQSQTQMLHEGPNCTKRNTWELACQGGQQDICVHAIGIIRTMGLLFMQSLHLKCFERHCSWRLLWLSGACWTFAGPKWFLTGEKGCWLVPLSFTGVHMVPALAAL